jgi:hypothetical protein
MTPSTIETSFSIIGTFVVCLVFLVITGGTETRARLAVKFCLNAMITCGTWGLIGMFVKDPLSFIVCELLAATAWLHVAYKGAYIYPWIVLSTVSCSLYCVRGSDITEFLIACGFSVYAAYWAVEHIEIFEKLVLVLPLRTTRQLGQ